MSRKIIFCMAMLWVYLYSPLYAQQYKIPAIKDSAVWQSNMQELAGSLLTSSAGISLNDLFRLQLLAGNMQEAKQTISRLRNIAIQEHQPFAGVQYIAFEMYAETCIQQRSTGKPFSGLFASLLSRRLQSLDDSTALQVSTAFTTLNGIAELENGFRKLLSDVHRKDSITQQDAIGLCKNYQLWQQFRQIETPAVPVLQKDDERRYVINDSVLIRTKDGATLSAIVARKRNLVLPQPAVLFFFIYTNTQRCLYEAKQIALHGYVGVVADTRGKRLSTDSIRPYECEVDDVNGVIDWISHQSWNNGKVGMYGGSYSGFAQWAALKHPHPALKTIVPYVAAIPGMGLPMENNIFLNANYGWAFYVGNNRYLDNTVYADRQRWRNMERRWFASGVAYRSIDSVDGTPNPWLQQWLKHPDYDSYWQGMVPYKEEFANIHIPVLSITGYYDDGQLSALHYLRQHVKYNKNAEHYLVIGPYDHFGAQRGGTPWLREYQVDTVALINTPAITFAWLDYILRNGKKPAILKDRINYEVMGANTWLHAPSLEKMAAKSVRLYLSDKHSGNYHLLTGTKPVRTGYLQQTVDFADRNAWNNDYYPDPIVRNEPDTASGFLFISDPFDKPVVFNGSFSGALKISINKKDADIGVTLYEVLPDGRLFHLSYFLGRASYAQDPAERHLLQPGVITAVSFSNTRLCSRQLQKGSRLLVMVNINKNPFAQVNYGTGKDVSDETIADAKEPLQIKWYNDSYINIPLLQ